MVYFEIMCYDSFSIAYSGLLLVYGGMLYFYMNFRIFFYICEQCHLSFMGTVLNL